MDQSQLSPEVLAMLQALQGQPSPQAGMAGPSPMDATMQAMNQPGMQASMGNGGMLGQQAPGMAGPLATPPPMTPPPAPIY